MAIQTITYSDKQAMGTQPSIPDINKVTDSDMNEIKDVVNNNANEITPIYCKATITTTPTASSNYYVPLNDFRINTGNFTFQDGGIKIPSGITHVRISGSVFLNNFPGGTNYLWTKIYRVRGTTTDHISGSLNNSTASFISASVPEVITNVQEGDIIKLMADSPNGGKIRAYGPNTWLMVEKID